MELTILDLLLTFGILGDSEVTGKADWGVGGQASDGSPNSRIVAFYSQCEQSYFTLGFPESHYVCFLSF